MDLQILIDKQAELDAHIEQEHPRQPGEDRLAKKILALQVELGELAQNWRGFKFWSNDQEPRTREYLTNYTEQDSILGPGAQWRNPLLEEYVDCLHFLLSIGLEIDEEIADWSFGAIEPFKPYGDDVVEQFIDMYACVNGLRNLKDSEFKYEPYVMTVNSYLGLGEMLGFTWKEVEQAYDAKHQINFERQANGY